MALPLTGIAEITQNQVSKYLTHNEALRDLESLIFRAVSATTNAQPGTPATGDVYILPGSLSGSEWGAYSEGQVAVYNNGEWDNFAPFEGLRLWVNDEDVIYVYDGTNWIGGIETYTPTIDFATTGDLSVTYSKQVGRYQKTNGKCIVDFNIETSAFTHTTASGALEILLPVTCATITDYRAVGTLSFGGITKASYSAFNVVVDSASGVAKVEALGSAQAPTDITASDMPTSGSVVLRGHIEYEI